MDISILSVLINSFIKYLVWTGDQQKGSSHNRETILEASLSSGVSDSLPHTETWRQPGGSLETLLVRYHHVLVPQRGMGPGVGTPFRLLSSASWHQCKPQKHHVRHTYQNCAWVFFK